ncbi:MAG TPA: hypothetical protein VFS38_05640 [Actinomycetota bacterium]|nr:hypothetical protein [Actinomycetota bacterium]
MTLLSARTRRLPVLLVTVVMAGALSGLAGEALSAPNLPRLEPPALLISVSRALADPPPVSGDFHTHLDLGLPALPEMEGAGGLSDLPAGDRELRIWLSDNGARISELRDTSERAFISDGSQAWTWDSERMTARHYRVPGGRQERSQSPQLAPRDRRLLRNWALDLPTHDIFSAAWDLLAEFKGTEVTVTEPQTVAGRDAYVLVMAPDDPGTLVGRFELAVDAEMRVPLRIEVYPRRATAPAISAGFSDVSFDPIDPDMFAFEAPPGVRVEEVKPPARPEGAWKPGSSASQKRGQGGMHRGHGMELERADARKWLEKHPASSLSAGRIESLLRKKWNEHWLAGHPEARGRSLGDKWLGNGPPVRRFGSGWTAVTAVLTEDPPAALQSLLPFEGTLFSAMLVESGDESWIVTGAVDLETLGAVALKLP